MYLLTSNPKKVEEFKELGLDVEIRMTGDIKEIRHPNSRFVAAHKAQEAGVGVLIEDTALNIHDASIGTDIKWMLDDLDEYAGSAADWVVTLAIKLEDGRVEIYEGILEGLIAPRKERDEEVFGFDDNFIPLAPLTEIRTLHELKMAGLKNEYSARKFAVDRFLAGERTGYFEELKAWEGKYQ